MSLHHLGEHVEIHTGGVDNRFPHHEDEIAQTEGAVGHEVVQLWVHGEHLLMDSAKMAKSAGNVVTIAGLVEDGVDPLAFRYLTFNGRYRRQVDFTEAALTSAGTTLRRLRERIAMLGIAGEPPGTDDAVRSSITDDRALGYHSRFVDAIDDDLDLPAAVTILHELISDSDVAPAHRWMLAASWDAVLGLDLAASDELDPALATLLDEREKARGRRDFARADEIRDQLRASGIDLLDSASGTRWVKRQGPR
jgi:cysteinyl-tRNA synthetase